MCSVIVLFVIFAIEIKGVRFFDFDFPLFYISHKEISFIDVTT